MRRFGNGNADYVVATYLKDEAENPAAHKNDGAAVAAFIEEYDAGRSRDGVERRNKPLAVEHDVLEAVFCLVSVVEFGARGNLL